tara:strand:- start:80 stop:931 length:852 start_codon:yes stop_codon:yes gene_type:complete
MGLINNNNERPIIIVGKSEKKCMEKALEFLPNNPIVKYANEYDIEDNYSLPISRGILIKEANYKPKADLIINTLTEYRGKVALISSNQKDVPKSLFNMLKLKRAIGEDYSTIEEIAPRSDPPISYDLDIFKLLMDYCKNSNREEVLTKLNYNLKSNQQSIFLTWLSKNIKTDELIFIDSKVKYQWDSSYFNELLAYAHDGKLAGRLNMPKRNARTELPTICRKLKLRMEEQHLLKLLLEDLDFQLYAKTKLTNKQYRILGLGEKSQRRIKAPKEEVITLDRWL